MAVVTAAAAQTVPGSHRDGLDTGSSDQLRDALPHHQQAERREEHLVREGEHESSFRYGRVGDAFKAKRHTSDVTLKVKSELPHLA